MTARRVDLREGAAQARLVGASGEASPLLTQLACSFVLDALEVDGGPTYDTLVTTVASSRNPLDESLLASPSGRSWMVSGAVRHVPHGRHAASLLTVVRSRPFAGRERGLRVYAVDAQTPGIVITPLHTIDDDQAVRIEFNAVQVGDDRAVGPSRDATNAVDAALDCATLVAIAEMLGAADAARRTAMSWVTNRVQFGEPLARRQVVAHRVADMTVACDAIGLLLDAALSSAGDNTGRPDGLAVATAKLAANRMLPTVTAHAHQLHGGEGFYEDRPLHHWHRRVTALATQFGDERSLRARNAELLGLPSAS
jgi:pimeloyl-CoA dehydrogenase